LDQIHLKCQLQKEIGLIGNNGIGKSTSLKILSGKQMPNFGNYLTEPSIQQTIEYFKGTELQQFLQIFM